MTRSSRFRRVSALITLLVISLALTTVFSPVSAQTSTTVVVTTGAANIRSGPGANTTSIGTVPAGAELVVSGRTANSAWWRVETPFGQGWISNETVAFRGEVAYVPVVAVPEGTLEQPTVIVDRLPVTVYRNPNTDSFIIGIAPTGMILLVTGYTADGAWYQVETVLGPGFVKAEEIAFRGTARNVPVVSDPGPSFDGPTVQVNTETPVLTAPGTGDVITVLEPGTTLPTGGRTADNTWWQVADVWGIGWIPVADVSLAGSASNIRETVNSTWPGPAYTGEAFATAIVGVDRKIAYQADSYDSVPYWDAFLGEALGITARSTNGLWLKVTRSGNAFEAWINFSGITLQGSLADVPVVDTTPPAIVNIAIVNTAWLNVRSGPDAKYQRIYVAPGGESLTVTGRTRTGAWMRVEREDFGIGWINSEFVIFRGDWVSVPVVREPVGEIELPVAYIEIPHNVYSQPSYDFPAGSIPPGLYTINGRNANFTWARIETHLGDVWINFDQIALRGIAASAPVVG